jgi:protein PhnA
MPACEISYSTSILVSNLLLYDNRPLKLLSVQAKNPPKIIIIKSGGCVSNLPKCPKCNSEYTYEDGVMYICPECAHEWAIDAVAEIVEHERVVRDAYGIELHDGDSVTVIKDLKLKGSSSVIKVGTKVRIIRLVDGDHDIDCKIDGIGAMQLKSEFVKKA